MSSDPIGDFLFGSGDGGNEGVLTALGNAGNWVADQISPSTVASNLSQAFGGGGQAAAPAVDPTAGAVTPPATDPTATGQYNPLAMQLYFANNIAPLLQQIMAHGDEQSKSFMDMAQQGTANLHLPSQYQGIFQAMLPRQQAAHSDVMSALAGAAVSAPALDSLMSQVHTATTQATKDYYAQEALRALGTAGGAIPTAADITAATGQTGQTGQKSG